MKITGTDTLTNLLMITLMGRSCTSMVLQLIFRLQDSTNKFLFSQSLGNQITGLSSSTYRYIEAPEILLCSLIENIKNTGLVPLDSSFFVVTGPMNIDVPVMIGDQNLICCSLHDMAAPAGEETGPRLAGIERQNQEDSGECQMRPLFDDRCGQCRRSGGIQFQNPHLDPQHCILPFR